MAGSRDEWDRYERWNDAIAEVVYAPAMAGKPVFLDLEDGLLEEVRQKAEPDAIDGASALIEAVKGTLLLRHGASYILRDHLQRIDDWYAGPMIEPPPCLGLLALLSFIAESMRDSQDMRAHNFYGRLAEILELNERQMKSFETAYRDRRYKEAASGELWGALNDWLEMTEGSRGLPTAVPVGHEHIGLPLSQALVRRADRDKFIGLFTSQGLQAGSCLPINEIAAHIDEWIARIPCPASNTLERLWKHLPASRQPIAEVAELTLEAWDGSLPDGLHQAVRREIDTVKLRAALRSFPSQRIDLTMVIPGRSNSDWEDIALLNEWDDPIQTIELVPFASGWLGLNDNSSIDPGSFLDGTVRLRRQTHGQPLQRRPRRLVPLRWDDLLLSFLECERVQLGEDSLVLSRVEIADRVTDFLGRAARPGFKQYSEFPGLPSNWTLFTDVQILVSGEREPLVDLSVLQPPASSHVVLQGGLRMPGHLRKWSSKRPPELRVSSEGGTKVDARLTCKRPLAHPTPPSASLENTGSILIWNLSELNLPDGDYEIAVNSDDELIGSELVRLRSADNPALQLDDPEILICHNPEQPGYGLVAATISTSRTFQLAPDLEGSLVSAAIPSVPSWWTARAAAMTARSGTVHGIIKFPQSTGSCLRGHHMDLPIGLEGQTSIEGICRNCGLVKRYPTKFRRRRDRTVGGAIPPQIRVNAFPSVRSGNVIDWAIAFDAVCHVGSGSISALERITSQMEATDLFGDSFERKLEVSGHVEIRRSMTTLAGVAWRTNNPTIIGLASGDSVLVGFRSDGLSVALEDEVWKAGGDLKVNDQVNAPPILRVIGLDLEGTRRLANAIEAATGRSTRFIPNAAKRLGSQLPKLSSARQGLPTTTTLSAMSYERWDPVSARFESVTDASAPGGFRLSGHTREYVYRQPEHLGTLRAILGDARIVKYLAALDSKSSLVGYVPDEEVLYVPLGADLPGLYGRAAVLASGFPPQENIQKRILEYRNVPAWLASQLAYLLIS